MKFIREFVDIRDFNNELSFSRKIPVSKFYRFLLRASFCDSLFTDMIPAYSMEFYELILRILSDLGETL